ncbi:hypothetical protein E2C01_051020 [Portunus trituberculatus]|uniref:Uncharacterized protein n=1 Tax=Portunus trituberculatus TaxID=210409 RepID=A0A5B7GHM5_PORTR|nr:hypothetical protein [Portunus trituberculatus]
MVGFEPMCGRLPNPTLTILSIMSPLPINCQNWGTAAKGSLGEATTPDPQIEAVRQQLLSFGVSFLDPTTLTPNSRLRPCYLTHLSSLF